MEPVSATDTRLKGFGTWEAFKTAFKAQFKDNYGKETAKEKWPTFQWRAEDTIRSYNTRFTQLATATGYEMDSIAVLDKYKDRLHNDIKNHVFHWDLVPTNLAGWKAATDVAYGVLRAQQATKDKEKEALLFGPKSKKAIHGYEPTTTRRPDL